MGITVGIDASRNRSGGARAHLIGILEEAQPQQHGIDAIHVWSYSALLDALPDAPWLVRHNPPALERSLPQQIWWQYRRLPGEARRAGCDVLLNTDAGSVCRFEPAVTMSRDMQSYEPGVAERYGISRARARLVLLRWIQNASLRRASGVIFLTRYAAAVIGKATGPLDCVRVIPHGVARAFRDVRTSVYWPDTGGEAIHCVYVSNVAPYKHQWHVVRAIAALREAGWNLVLTLAGGGHGAAQDRLDDEITRSDPDRRFVRTPGPVPHDEVPALLATAHLFVFASSCENMPNTLLEAMSAGLPIACSDRGPMPEVLADAGVYFDPEQPAVIAGAIEDLLAQPALRAQVAQRAAERADRYSWSQCAAETLDFLALVGGGQRATGASESRSALLRVRE